MNSLVQSLAVLFTIAYALSCSTAAQTVAGGHASDVPPFVRYQGTIKNEHSLTAGTHNITFRLYQAEDSQDPLWTEIQAVTVDSSGHFTAMLGSASAEGIPIDLFASGDARWLSVQAEGGLEQTRTLLLSVPYALKASDAETIGGLP